jgi:hypothetical protein
MRCNPSCDASLTPCPFPGVSPIAISGSRRGRRPSSLGRQPDRVAVVSHSRARLAVTPSEPRAHDPWSRLRRWATVSDSAITTAATATTHVSAWFGRGAGPPASGVSPIAISAFARGAGPPASGVSPFPDPARPVPSGPPPANRTQFIGRIGSVIVGSAPNHARRARARAPCRNRRRSRSRPPAADRARNTDGIFPRNPIMSCAILESSFPGRRLSS